MSETSDHVVRRSRYNARMEEFNSSDGRSYVHTHILVDPSGKAVTSLWRRDQIVFAGHANDTYAFSLKRTIEIPAGMTFKQLVMSSFFHFFVPFRVEVDAFLVNDPGESEFGYYVGDAVRVGEMPSFRSKRYLGCPDVGEWKLGMKTMFLPIEESMSVGHARDVVFSHGVEGGYGTGRVIEALNPALHFSHVEVIVRVLGARSRNFNGTGLIDLRFVR